MAPVVYSNHSFFSEHDIKDIKSIIILQVEEALSPGLTSLTWTSMNINGFIEGVHAALKDLELLLDR